MSIIIAAVAVVPPTPHFPDENLIRRRRYMTSLSLRRQISTSFFYSSSRQIRLFSSSPSPSPIRASLAEKPVSSPARKLRAREKSPAKTEKEANGKVNQSWLASLYCPQTPTQSLAGDGDGDGRILRLSSSDLVIGIDPDLHGAVALLKGNGSDCSAQVFDTPNLQMLLGKRAKTRLDTKSIIELLRSFDAPVGTSVFIEKSGTLPTDGIQGCWSNGFGYGQWIGSLVALGFSVIPVSSMAWKRKFEIHGKSFTKDDSRRVASTLFPSLSSSMKRKKDHGRAEALLIAAYGQGVMMES